MKFLLVALIAVFASTWAAPTASVQDTAALLSQQLRQLGFSLSKPSAMTYIKDQITDMGKTINLMYRRLEANHGVEESDLRAFLKIVNTLTIEAIRTNPATLMVVFQPEGPLKMAFAKLSIIGDSMSQLADILDESVKSFDTLMLFRENAAAQYFITQAHDIIKEIETFIHKVEDFKNSRESKDHSEQETADHPKNAENNNDNIVRRRRS